MADANLTDVVYLVGMWNVGWAEEERLDERRRIWRVRPRIGSQTSGLIVKMMRYLEWQLKIFMRFRASPVKVVNCHSLPVLPIGVLFKLYCRSILVYDTHELETETDSAVGAKRVLYQAVEKRLIRFVDVVITVSDSIAQAYKAAYRLKHIYVVRNIPYQQDESIGADDYLKAKFEIRYDEMLYIFQGNLTRGRGIEILLDVFSKMDRSKHIVFMGFGELVSMVQDHSRMYSNIHLQEAVNPQDVCKITSGADVGICLQENISLNHYLTIPNKFFEYIMSGLPVITSDFPEMSRVIDKSGCGWKVPANRDALLLLIKAMSREEVSIKREKAMQYRKTIGWQQEEKVLLEAYHNLGLVSSR